VVQKANANLDTAKHKLYELLRGLAVLKGQHVGELREMSSSQQDKDKSQALADQANAQAQEYLRQSQQSSTTTCSGWWLWRRTTTVVTNTNAMAAHTASANEQHAKEADARGAADRFKRAEAKTEQLRGQIDGMEKRVNGKNEDVTAAANVVTVAKHDVETKQADISTQCKRHGGGSVGHVVNVLTTVAHMREFSKGNPTLKQFAAEIQRIFEALREIISRFDDCESVDEQLNLAAQLEGELNNDLLLPVVYMRNEMKSRLDGAIEANQRVLSRDDKAFSSSMALLLAPE